MKPKRIAWAIAVRGNTDQDFMVIPSLARTSRAQAIRAYYATDRYKQRKRQGLIKTIPIFVNEEDLK